MQPQERDFALLWDMREAIRQIQEFLQDVDYPKYVASRLLQSAVERQLEILGEAARRISVELQQGHPEIPWRAMVGLRNILAHEYGEVNQDRLWLVITANLDKLARQLDGLIPPLEDGGHP
jgi:uncharacterized protein with HEPN domain